MLTGLTPVKHKTERVSQDRRRLIEGGHLLESAVGRYRTFCSTSRVMAVCPIPVTWLRALEM